MSERAVLLAEALGHWALAWTLVVMAFITLGAAGSVRLIGFAGRAMADEPVDTPLPHVSSKELAAKIRKAMKAYDDIGSIRVGWPGPRRSWASGPSGDNHAG